MRWSTDDGTAVKPLSEIVLPDFELVGIKTSRIEEVLIFLSFL